MPYKKYIVVGFLLLGLQPSLRAQQPEDTLSCPRSRYCWFNLAWDNSWLEGENAAALTRNPNFNLSYFEVGANHIEGDFRNAYDPVSENNYQLTAASYLKLDKTYLYGRFSYSYNPKHDVQWYGLLNPYSTPFLMADSIPGDFNLEQFFLDGGIAHPLSKQWTLGAYVSYNVASGGKTKDLRNKNKYMHFSLRPSVLFQTGKLTFGLNATYDRQTENVDYATPKENKPNVYLYFFEGMWYYNREVRGTSTPAVRLKEDESYGGALQFELKTQNFRFYNEFSLLQTDQEQTDGMQAFGNVSQMHYAYTGVISINSKHQVNLAAANTSLDGYNVLQKKEWHDPSKSYQFTTFATNKVYTRSITDGLLSYTFHKMNADKSLCLEATIGGRGYMWDIDRTANPYTNENWQYAEVFASVTKRWYLGIDQLEIRPHIFYGTGDGVPKKITSSSGSGGLSQEVSALMKEFDFMTATRTGGDLAIRYSYGLKPNGDTKIYGELGGGYARALSASMNGEYRSTARITLGVSF